MTPQQAIAALDRGIWTAGQSIALRRYTGTSAESRVYLEVEARAVVTGFAPAELVDGIKQGDRTLIMSPTEMTRGKWCWPPRIGDKAVIGGRETNVEAVTLREIGDVLVRIEMRVRG